MTEKLTVAEKISSKGTSLGVTLPKEVSEMLNVGEKDHVGFYFNEKEVIVRKID